MTASSRIDALTTATPPATELLTARIEAASTGFEAARDCMVDSQVRPNKVNDPRILGAMRRIPREDFLPADLAARAYSDDDVPLGGSIAGAGGRYLTSPMVIARLVQLARVQPGERVLVVAAGPGYGAALIAACGGVVFALEDNPALAALATRALAASFGAVVVTGPLAEGWPGAAPYDLILIEGAVREIPAAIAAQLHPQTGRLVSVHQLGGPALPNNGASRHGVGQAILAERTAAGLRMRPAFDCAAPLIAALLPPPTFVF